MTASNGDLSGGGGALDSDDEPLFGDDEPLSLRGGGPRSRHTRHAGSGEAAGWTVLVIDDEPEVHAVTSLALRDLTVDGLPLRIEGAASLEEARALLSAHPDAAVALIDVVMETDDAGLTLVRFIREELQNHAIRIVLRTGQPGMAPEERVMMDYDINDYRSKTEITAQRLRTTTAGAIRSYRDLMAIEGHRSELVELVGAFGLFVPQELLKLLGRVDVRGVRVGDHVSLEMAVLFCDLRSFTSVAERLTPEETFRLVNELFSLVAPAIERHGGVVDKYLGDGLMALFPTRPANAVRAALEMLAALRRRGEESPLLQRLWLGVGIHSGPLILGTVGHAGRLDTTVISDVVNVAARLERLTRAFDVSLLVSAEAASEMDVDLQGGARRLGTAEVRGKREPVALVEVFAGDPPALLEAKRASREAFEEAVARIDERAFDEAAEQLRAIVRACPEDRPAAALLSQCEQRRGARDSSLPSERGGGAPHS